MNRPTIAFVRETTLLTDALVESYVAAQQVQISRDFAPMWGIDAVCVFVPPGQGIPLGAWQIIFLDHSDQADALGYHDATGPNGVPRGKVFIADALADRVAWTVTASHETLEMLADPNIDRVAQRVEGGVTWDYAWEVCDAPEDDRFAYPVHGHHLTAFVTPAWFDPAGRVPFTYPVIPSIAAPFALAEGGYIGRREIAPAAGAWDQVMADGAPGARAVGKRATSRTMRRFGTG